ncbi:hypothetical protein BMEI0348 [Brucella melitensis bv. 1 str. 16M]|uniref:Uncharacterized protein n=1 Tax=Brucella melitensis biotype 1 (strain ATCC 23456 / CCUG 17765 / NCTC 10094 / 16M) TaxID=224914 RepID=Q8YIU4_BRUME|nr:hypothetical protein BMEI0348 [Brucella melitensis bv. 1 str. 16M]
MGFCNAEGGAESGGLSISCMNAMAVSGRSWHAFSRFSISQLHFRVHFRAQSRFPLLLEMPDF